MARLTVRLTPRAGRDAIDGWRGDVLLARVAAAPTDGNANNALIRLLAKRLGIAPSRIALVSGGQTRTKVIEIDGLAENETRARLGTPTAKR
ncbi:MAG: DUF167 domain-containing protein [Chloroflexota bacterium]|nr:DUF167 domain-containing protein [Chloroflexota bacterium]